MGFKIYIEFGKDKKFEECKALIDQAVLTKDFKEQKKLLELAFNKARAYGIYSKVRKYTDEVFGI
jgi:hypothetical protein